MSCARATMTMTKDIKTKTSNQSLHLGSIFQSLDEIEIEEEKKDLISREIRSFRDTHKVTSAQIAFSSPLIIANAMSNERIPSGLGACLWTSLLLSAECENNSIAFSHWERCILSGFPNF